MRISYMKADCIFFACLITSAAAAAELQEVASFSNQQVTGVAVSLKSGRIFVSFPNWSDDHKISVAEIVKGQLQPFPNDEWNKQDAPASHFVCVQTVVIDDQDNLWILDPAAPKMQGIVKGGPKLVKVDLTTNRVVQTISFGEDIAPDKSYLNDVRIDTRANNAFITESGTGAIIVVDLKSGKARRLLHDHASTQPEKDFQLTVDGKHLIDANTKKPPHIASDGIALDTTNGYLYYHALTAHTFYRIKTSYLTDEKLSQSDLESKVENLGQTPAPDGMLEAPDGSVYLTDLEGDGIVRWDVNTQNLEPVIADKRLLWPDTMTWGPNHAIYVTASQIQNMPRFNTGHSIRVEPYKLWKIFDL